MGTALHEKAMLAKLSISQWTARRYDKKISDEVAEKHAAQAADKNDVGRYNKVLISQEAIKKIAHVVNAARTYHMEMTLPWHDDGARILPSANYNKYMEGMRGHRSAFEARVAEFCETYPALIEEARQRLNGMFNEADYPRPSDIDSRYSFRVGFDPLPTGGDFRVAVAASDMARIQQEIDERLQAAQVTAMRDLWGRLHAVISRMAERLGDADNKFKDSLVGNIVELIDLLPALNVADDPNLEAMRRRVEKTLCQYDPKELRNNDKERGAAAREAQAILDAMAGYMGGGK